MNEHWLEWLFGVVATGFAWLCKRLHDRVDWHDKNSVTREELKDALAGMRQDGKEKHEQNRQALSEIKRTIDENEERDANTRHDIRESVHDIALQIAVMNGRPDRTGALKS